MTAHPDPIVGVMLRLPASVMAQLPEAVAAVTGLPAPASRAATVTAALGAFIVHSRQTGAIRPPTAPAAPVSATDARHATRQRLQSMTVPQHSTSL